MVTSGAARPSPCLRPAHLLLVHFQATIILEVTRILNKITEQTYDVLSEELWKLFTRVLTEIPDALESVVETMFDVALNQANFGPLCAELCYFLCAKIKNLKRPDGEDAEGHKSAAQQLAEFRHMLLRHCQVPVRLCAYSGSLWVPVQAEGAHRALCEK